MLDHVFGRRTSAEDKQKYQDPIMENTLSQAACLIPKEQAALVNALVHFALSPRTLDNISRSTTPLLNCACDMTDAFITMAHQHEQRSPYTGMDPCTELCSSLFHTMSTIIQLPLDPAKTRQDLTSRKFGQGQGQSLRGPRSLLYHRPPVHRGIFIKLIQEDEIATRRRIPRRT